MIISKINCKEFRSRWCGKYWDKAQQNFSEVLKKTRKKKQVFANKLKTGTSKIRSGNVND
jgi:hypothetical protein